jgi:hypothetical protein
MLYSLRPPSEDGVNYVFLIDGAFDWYIDKFWSESDFWHLSTDGSREMIKTFEEEQLESGSRGINVVLDDLPGSEIDKRSRYLELCRRYDCNYLLIVDSDEFFIYDNKATDWPVFWKNFLNRVIQYGGHNVFSLNTIVNEYGKIMKYPRCWYDPGAMIYRDGLHWTFANFLKGQHLETALAVRTQYSLATVEGATLKHDHGLRTDKDMKDREKYDNWLVAFEKNLMNGMSKEEAAKAANEKPAEHRNDCVCPRCVDFYNRDLSKIFDSRPPEKRTNDPYAQIRKKREENKETVRMVRQIAAECLKLNLPREEMVRFMETKLNRAVSLKELNNVLKKLKTEQKLY